MAPTPAKLIEQLLAILRSDREKRLLKIDAYIRGDHDDPYMPDSADAEYRMLAKRATSNWIPLMIATPAEALYVDGFRRGGDRDDAGDVSKLAPEWAHWQFSRLDARQVAVHRAAIGYGHSFVLTERDPKRGGRAVSKGLSPLRTAALYEDPANDIDPAAVVHVDTWSNAKGGAEGRLWTETHVYTWVELGGETDRQIRVKGGVPHGASHCPVTRFAASIDLEGRTLGVVEPMISLQDRINQTIFDLLIAQTGSSFKVRYATGMAPPLKLDPETKQPVIDPETGRPIPLPVNLNAKKFLFNTDPDGKFGTLDETPLDGYISSIEMSIRHLAAISQTPPHHLLGQIANLSAEALEAAEVSLARKIEEFRKVFGESWERVFQIAAELDEVESSEDWDGEVIWRELNNHAIARDADALGKISQLLGVPGRGLWHRIPGTTQGELKQWQKLYDEQGAADPRAQLAEALTRSSGNGSTARQAAQAAA